MKYLALLPLVLLACGSVDGVDGFNGTGGVISFGGSVSGGVGGISSCDPDQHCYGGNGGVGGVVVTGGTNTGGVTQTGGTVSTGGTINEGGSAGQGGDDSSGSGGCDNTCDNDYTVCKTKCYTKQCNRSVRWECLCQCKKIHEECNVSSCDTTTHTCSH